MHDLGPSIHLSWRELACRDEDRTQYPPTWLDRAMLLASEFEALRERCAVELGVETPIKVISAYRTNRHNQSVGGAGRSQHVEGRALDLAPPAGMDYDRFVALVIEQAQRRGIIRGVGAYPREARPHVHLDVRLARELAFWKE